MRASEANSTWTREPSTGSTVACWPLPAAIQLPMAEANSLASCGVSHTVDITTATRSPFDHAR